MRETDIIDAAASGHSVYSAPVPDGCSQVFAPCLDPQCERPCGARRSAAEINRDIARETQEFSFWTMAFVAVAIFTIFAAAGSLRAVEAGTRVPDRGSRLMVASAIAYLLTAIFVVPGILGFIVAWRGKREDRGSSVTLSIFTLALAWLCAHLGGI